MDNKLPKEMTLKQSKKTFGLILPNQYCDMDVIWKVVHDVDEGYILKPVLLEN